MEPPAVERKLTAILSADVAGYSRLMGDDEAATVETLTTYRKVFAECIDRHRGRVVNAPGDAILAEFGSVVDAVACAVEIQRELAERNQELPSERMMRFRIGVNLGDVVVREGAIYGDGVNIAARLESLAEPGGITLSGSAFDQVENKLPLAYVYLGQKEVKNISKPLRTYRILSKPGSVAHRMSQARRGIGGTWRAVLLVSMALAIVVGLMAGAWVVFFRIGAEPPGLSHRDRGSPLSEKPSIAVLPFTNTSGDPDQDFFSDGITDDIIAHLAVLRGLKVIARDSTFKYKGLSPDARQVSRELGVRFVLEGGVGSAGDRVRIDARLIDSSTGEQLWAERFVRSAGEIFTVQEDITRAIVAELGVNIPENRQMRDPGHAAAGPEAYSLLLKGRQEQWKRNKRAMARARAHYEAALQLAPRYAAAKVQLGWLHYTDAVEGWSSNYWGSLNRALELGKEAIALDSRRGIAHTLVGYVLLTRDGNAGRAIEYCERGLSLAPNNGHVVMVCASIHSWTDGGSRALELARHGMQINPVPPAWYFNALGMALWRNGQNAEAVPVLEKCRAMKPNDIWCPANLIVAYAKLGDREKAAASAEALRRINPQVTSDFFTAGFQDSVLSKELADIFRQVGISPEME